MKPRDRIIAPLFFYNSGSFLVRALSALSDEIRLATATATSWLLMVYALVLCGLSLAVVLRCGWARWPAAVLLAPLVWYGASEVLRAEYVHIMGGSGPDANPMEGVIYLKLAAAAGLAFISAAFAVWLVTLRFSVARNKAAKL